MKIIEKQPTNVPKIEKKPTNVPDINLHHDFSGLISSPISLLLSLFIAIRILQKVLDYIKIPAKLFTNLTSIQKEELILLNDIENLMFLLMGRTGASRCIVAFFQNTNFREFNTISEYMLHDKKINAIFETHLPHITEIRSSLQNVKLTPEIINEIQICSNTDTYVTYVNTSYKPETPQKNTYYNSITDKYLTNNHIWKKSSILLRKNKSFYGILYLYYTHTGNYENIDLNTPEILQITHNLSKFIEKYRYPKPVNYFNRISKFLKDIAD